MKRFAAGFPLAMCVCLLCSCAPKLTKQSAYDVLVKYHAPKLEAIYVDEIPEDSVLGRNINELINSKYFAKSDSVFAVDTYLVTDEANRRTGTVTHHHFKKYYRINVPVAISKVGEVEEIIEDSANNMAVVLYKIAWEPLEPYYSKLCIDSTCKYYGDWLKNTSRSKIYFKQFDEGWKIVR
jgi:hypothetical protein